MSTEEPVVLPPGWQKRINEQATETLRNLPASARPQRERPTYFCRCGWDKPHGPTCPDCRLPIKESK